MIPLILRPYQSPQMDSLDNDVNYLLGLISDEKIKEEERDQKIMEAEEEYQRKKVEKEKENKQSQE